METRLDPKGRTETTVGEVKGKLEAYDSTLEVLKSKMASVAEDAREGYAEQLSALRVKRDALHARLTDAMVSADDAWDHVTDGLKEAWDDVRTAFAKMSGD